ncbi:MAG: glycoside hydrolase family 127 protein [Akkermansiaceae bacterium]|nr:glycoside hydrolase family 127 protein [Akkermansiaceae bacterium]
MKQTFAFSNALHRIAGSGSILTVIAVLSVSINTGTVAGAPEDEARKAAGMGVERVARLFTPVYESKRAKSDDESRWVQVDLGAERKIESVKLLPMVVWWNCQSQGFPVRFKLEASLDPNFGSATLIADCSQADYPDPVDAVATFTANSVQGRYVRLTASRLRQNQLALTKMIVLSGGKDVAEGGRVSDSESGDLGLNVLTRPPRPQGEYVVTDNPGNVIPPDRWKPVDYLAKAPLGGIELGEGLFKKVMDDNAEYLLSAMTLDEMTRHFLKRAGKPAAPLASGRSDQWFNTLPGSEAGHFLMGAGNSLRWFENPALRERMNQVVDVIDECKEGDGFIMGYPRAETFKGENGAYVRSWLTHGLIEAGYAGNPKAFPLLRGYYDWFNTSCYLPELLRRTGQGTQGIIPSTRMYFTPVGKPEDLLVVQRYFQENYWMDQLAKREEKAIWLYPYDRPHNYLVTGIEPYLDLYRATGVKKYLDAALGGWDLYRDHWEHIGGLISISEGTSLYPPDSNPLRRGGELCGNVFWVQLNQRFHLLYPKEEKYVTEIEKSIYNATIPNQIGSKGIRYHARLVDHKDTSHGPYFHCMNTCCEGQGTRLFGSLPEYIYSLAADGIYVDLFADSKINFEVGGNPLSLKTTTRFPYDPQVRIEVRTGKRVQAKIRIRIPSWAVTTMPVLVNDKLARTGEPGTYVTIDREWSDSDVISFALPMGFRTTCYRGTESGYNDGAHYALEYGPVLMALTGKVEGQDGVNADPKQLSELLRPIPGKPLHFEVMGNDSLIYQPYWELQDERFTCFPRIQKIK